MFHQDNASKALSENNFDRALRNLNEASKIANQTSIDTLRANTILSVGEMYYYIHNFNKAKDKVNVAISLYEQSENENEIGLAKSYNLLGLIQTRIGNFEASEGYLKLADRVFVRLNDERNRANVLLGLGLLELEREEPTKAVNYFDACIPLFKEYKFEYQEAFASLKKADALLLLDSKNPSNVLPSAEASLKSAENIINRKKYTRLSIDAYNTKAQIEIIKGNNSLAATYLKLHTKQKDSIYKIYIDAISKGIDEESEVSDLNQIIALQKDNLIKSQESINFIKMTTGLSIALIVILSLLTLSLFKNNNLRAKANNLLQDKNTELLLSKEKAEQASLAKAQFLSTITHELRTPLYAVTGLTHLLLEENPKDHQKEHLNSLKFSGEYLLSLINNILDLNKLEANKVEMEKTEFDLKRRISDVLIALKKSADDRKNNLVFEFDENIPNRILGDPLKLSQILINLIGNSLKFTQNGQVTIRVKRMDDSRSRVMLYFEIEDTGVGISQKKQKSIFESFSQASLQINRKFGGTGLGLSIVKNLLELMNSKIHLESQLGKGSKFSFTLGFDPAKQYENNTTIELAPEVEIDFEYLEDKKVLVVEDNKINQMITRKILEKNKFVCQVSDNGTDAVKLVKDTVFDIVLMDIHMPGISGIEATQKIRKFNTNIPIIALTAVTIDENLDEFYKAGFNEIIPKPFKTEEFFDKIYHTLKARKTTV